MAKEELLDRPPLSGSPALKFIERLCVARRLASEADGRASRARHKSSTRLRPPRPHCDLSPLHLAIPRLAQLLSHGLAPGFIPFPSLLPSAALALIEWRGH
eukprot:scaffold129781_cov33-Tisochrysis_lutea.AAC.1